MRCTAANVFTGSVTVTRRVSVFIHPLLHLCARQEFGRAPMLGSLLESIGQLDQ
jgi:hypothetical protein